jgi:hypothetical protein
VQRGFLCRPIEGAAQRLSIDRDRVPCRRGEVFREAQEADVELREVEQAEYTAEGVVAGNATA